jgi:hypothetical protein
MSMTREVEIYETARKIADVLAEIRQLSLECQAATTEFRRKALEVTERLNAFLKNLQIPGRYVDLPFYSRYDDVMGKWESGYRLIIENSQLMVEEFDEWRSYMYPDSENPILSFDSLSTERLADAIEQIPDFLRYVAERLSERKMKYQQLSSIAQAFLSVLQSEADAL